jgi:hypothetical protein
LKNKINEKEESCHKLEDEVVDIRKKIEKSNTHTKFMNNSTILDELLDSQRSPHDKSVLGYNKEVSHLESSTSKKHEVSTSFSKGGRNYESQPSTQSKEDIKKPYLHHKENSKEKHLHGGHQSKGMKTNFIVTNLWIADIMQGKIMEGFITP